MADYIISSLSAVFSPRCRVMSHTSTIPDKIYYDVEPIIAVEDVMTVTEDYTATTENFTILCDCTDGPITISLPSLYDEGVDELELNITKIDTTTNRVTIDAWKDQTINRRLLRYLRRQDANLTIIADADGGRWQIL